MPATTRSRLARHPAAQWLSSCPPMPTPCRPRVTPRHHPQRDTGTPGPRLWLGPAPWAGLTGLGASAPAVAPGRPIPPIAGRPSDAPTSEPRPSHVSPLVPSPPRPRAPPSRAVGAVPAVPPGLGQGLVHSRCRAHGGCVRLRSVPQPPPQSPTLPLLPELAALVSRREAAPARTRTPPPQQDAGPRVPSGVPPAAPGRTPAGRSPGASCASPRAPTPRLHRASRVRTLGASRPAWSAAPRGPRGLGGACAKQTPRLLAVPGIARPWWVSLPQFPQHEPEPPALSSRGCGQWDGRTQEWARGSGRESQAWDQQPLVAAPPRRGGEPRRPDPWEQCHPLGGDRKCPGTHCPRHVPCPPPLHTGARPPETRCAVPKAADGP